MKLLQAESYIAFTDSFTYTELFLGVCGKEKALTYGPPNATFT